VVNRAVSLKFVDPFDDALVAETTSLHGRFPLIFYSRHAEKNATGTKTNSKAHIASRTPRTKSSPWMGNYSGRGIQLSVGESRFARGFVIFQIFQHFLAALS